MGRNERIGLLDDGRSIILDDEHADVIAQKLARYMNAQQHPFQYPQAPGGSRPRGASDVRANQYGGKVVLKFNPSPAEVNSGIRQSATLVDWTSPDGHAHPCTVEIGRVAAGGGGSFPAITDASGNTLFYRPFAQVVYGTPSAMQDPFYIDINRGQRFTVDANYVAVTAQMATIPSPAVSGSIAVFGNIGSGEAISTAPVLFTQYSDQIGPIPNNFSSGGGTVNQFSLIIPPKANILFPPLVVNGGTNVTLTFLDVNGTTVWTITYAVATPPLTPFFIPVDAYTVVVSSPGSISLKARLVYQLSI